MVDVHWKQSSNNTTVIVSSPQLTALLLGIRHDPQSPLALLPADGLQCSVLNHMLSHTECP